MNKKNEIIKILSESGTTPAVLDNFQKGIYIWNNDVFVLKDAYDMEFDDLDDSEKDQILTELKNGRYQLNRDGPAIEWVNGRKNWFLNGNHLTKYQIKQIIRDKRLNKILGTDE